MKKKKCLNPDTTHVDKVPEDENSFQIQPGYFKAGVDYSYFLESTKGKSIVALDAWGESLVLAGRDLKKLALALKDRKIRVDCADNHMVCISTKDKEALATLRKLAESQLGCVVYMNYWKCEGGKGYEVDQGYLDAVEELRLEEGPISPVKGGKQNAKCSPRKE